MRNYLSGEPDAGKPPVRFGGRGEVNPSSRPLYEGQTAESARHGTQGTPYPPCPATLDGRGDRRWHVTDSFNRTRRTQQDLTSSRGTSASDALREVRRFMRTEVPEKILKIIDDIEVQRNVPLTRLTVLKKWFESPRRLSAFGLWIARRRRVGRAITMA